MTRFLIAFLALTVSACSQGSSSEQASHHDEALRDSVHAFLETIPVGLAAEGPKAWLRFFEETPSFFMASDGHMAFPGRDSAAVFLEGFSQQVSAMDLTWERIRVEPLAPGVAVIAASYRERITASNDTVSEFGGYVTGIARSHAGQWKLQHLHWSSPVSMEE